MDTKDASQRRRTLWLNFPLMKRKKIGPDFEQKVTDFCLKLYLDKPKMPWSISLWSQKFTGQNGAKRLFVIRSVQGRTANSYDTFFHAFFCGKRCLNVSRFIVDETVCLLINKECMTVINGVWFVLRAHWNSYSTVAGRTGNCDRYKEAITL